MVASGASYFKPVEKGTPQRGVRLVRIYRDTAGRWAARGGSDCAVQCSTEGNRHLGDLFEGLALIGDPDPRDYLGTYRVSSHFQGRAQQRQEQLTVIRGEQIPSQSPLIYGYKPDTDVASEGMRVLVRRDARKKRSCESRKTWHLYHQIVRATLGYIYKYLASLL